MADYPQLSDEDAKAELQKMRWQAATLFRALDTDGDGVLSPDEIDAAPETLRALDKDGDGYLHDEDLGGPTLIPGLVRRSGIVRLLDHDGDLRIGPEDIAAAPERIRLLDTDCDGFVTALDDLPPPGANTENRMPLGTPSQTLEFQQKLFTREKGPAGPLPPQGRADVQPGCLLIQECNDRSDVQKSGRVLLMDDHGNVAHRWKNRDRLPETTVSYLLSDGNLLRTTCKHDWLVMDGQFPIGACGTVSIETKDSTVIWEWTHFKPGAEALHHDIEMLPNGNIFVISWSVLAAAEAQKLGWQQQGDRAFIVLDKIYEIKPDLVSGATEIVWQWSIIDHLVQYSDAALPNYGAPSAHPGKININWPQLDNIQFNANQLLHMNSVSYHEQDDIILLSSAIFGEIWIIDHSTTTSEASTGSGGRYGCGGDLIWRWGNPQTYDAGDPTDQILYWQHDAYFLADDVPHSGDLLIFNNGMRRDAKGNPEYDQICMGLITGAYSDVLELRLPRSADGRLMMHGIPEIVWSYNSDGKADLYSPFMSGARRMPNGNTLMVQACDKRVVEVTAEGETVMDFHIGGAGRIFRLAKYAPDYPGILALEL